MATDMPFSVHPTLSLVAAVGADWERDYAAICRRSGFDVRFADGGDALAAELARSWTVDLVILDLALATPALAARLGPHGPLLLAFGDPANAGIALAANLAGFLDECPEASALVAALTASTMLGPPAGVAELSDRSRARIDAQAAEAERVAAALRRLEANDAEPPPVDPDMIRGLIRARQLRSRFLPAEIFGEPAWDVLLELTLARDEGRNVPVSNLCLAAAVPTTTALRAIHSLCGAGLLVRTNDPRDARRAFIALAEPTARAMAAYLAKL